MIVAHGSTLLGQLVQAAFRDLAAASGRPRRSLRQSRGYRCCRPCRRGGCDVSESVSSSFEQEEMCSSRSLEVLDQLLPLFGAVSARFFSFVDEHARRRNDGDLATAAQAVVCLEGSNGIEEVRDRRRRRVLLEDVASEEASAAESDELCCMVVLRQECERNSPECAGSDAPRPPVRGNRRPARP